jgi:hypothetical protein
MDENGQLDMSAYLTVDEVLQLSPFRHIKSNTLAKWRQQNRGPRFVSIGRKPFYTKESIREFLLQKEKDTKLAQKSKVLAPVIQHEQPRHNRLGSHKQRKRTKID